MSACYLALSMIGVVLLWLLLSTSWEIISAFGDAVDRIEKQIYLVIESVRRIEREMELKKDREERKIIHGEMTLFKGGKK